MLEMQHTFVFNNVMEMEQETAEAIIPSLCFSPNTKQRINSCTRCSYHGAKRPEKRVKVSHHLTNANFSAVVVLVLIFWTD